MAPHGDRTARRLAALDPLLRHLSKVHLVFLVVVAVHWGWSVFPRVLSPLFEHLHFEQVALVLATHSGEFFVLLFLLSVAVAIRHLGVLVRELGEELTGLV